MLVQGLALGMTSMEERFQNWGRIMIQNQVHQPHILKRRMTNDAKLAALDQKLIVHNLRIMTLENVEHNEERMEESESEHLPQPTYPGNRGKHNLFDEWMDSIEHLDAFVIDKPTDMEVEEEVTDYMDIDPAILMLREEGAYWEPLAIMEAMTELKNWA